MEFQKELFYKEFIRRENDMIRAPYNPELEFYSVIKSGNVEKIRELCKEPLMNKAGLGTLSQNDLQNIKYHFVVTTALTARYCIEGGMDLATAYSLSDYYIQKADSCKSIKAVSDLHPVMCEDYTKRMKNLRKNKICSKQIVDCIDYIYEHLHKRITIEMLANHVDLTPSYLSRLFKKEIGTSVSGYIQTQKIETAKNMLIYSEYSLSEISSTLAFPNQSYFTEIFKKKTGLTPGEYRSLNFRKTEIRSITQE